MKTIIQEFICNPEEYKSFDEVAIQLFRYLYQNNLAYQQYCRKKGIGLKQVRHWKDIPSVSTEAFKSSFLSVTPEEECSYVFMTSGTTNGNKGKHYHRDLDVYDLSAKESFKNFVSAKKYPMAILFPDEKNMPHSSLSHYLSLLKADGTKDSAHFVSKDGLELEKLIEWTQKHEHTPVMILGASYNYVHLLDSLEDKNKSIHLHEDSLIFDTGGFKNFSRSYSENDFYKLLKDRFKVKTKIVNMYGMTELSSQYYSKIELGGKNIKRGPHWIRFKIIDPITEQEVPKGEIGLLVHVDLANINSVPAIQTGDLAIEREGGFELVGRQPLIESRGCSLSAQQWIEEYQNGSN
ncbi:MAG: LuxE/PaaK family acyltransferase [Ruoffia tabacinasalis]|uniref:LuxE/PaaK family acyltransferase n=1 Tax=unclassified Ruoffia TaxID=2862149 RepID=UPI000EEBCDF7|nr:long-chain fatty acid--CoA ligase [Aerococcaceae bacterium]